MKKNELDVIHLAEKSRFEIHLEGQMAELDYRLRDSVISFTHTGVPRALEGRGIGSLIVDDAGADSRDESLLSDSFFILEPSLVGVVNITTSITARDGHVQGIKKSIVHVCLVCCRVSLSSPPPHPP